MPRLVWSLKVFWNQLSMLVKACFFEFLGHMLLCFFLSLASWCHIFKLGAFHFVKQFLLNKMIVIFSPIRLSENWFIGSVAGQGSRCRFQRLVAIIVFPFLIYGDADTGCGHVRRKRLQLLHIVDSWYIHSVHLVMIAIQMWRMRYVDRKFSTHWWPDMLEVGLITF